MLLLVLSCLAHLFGMFFDINDTISKFVVVLRCRRSITLGGSDTREVGINTRWNKLSSMYVRLITSQVLMEVFTKNNNINLKNLKTMLLWTN